MPRCFVLFGLVTLFVIVLNVNANEADEVVERNPVSIVTF